MVPWPIALLSLWYGVVAALSAAALWKVSSGMVQQPLIWPLSWLIVSTGAMVGLALLRSWGRVLAILGAWMLVLVTLAMSGLLIVRGQPLVALATTLASGCDILAIRYLKRPSVKAYFSSDNMERTR